MGHKTETLSRQAAVVAGTGVVAVKWGEVLIWLG